MMKRRAAHMITAFVVPVMILLGIYAVLGQYPFGDRSLLIWDMDRQYAPFFAHLHDILHGDASALYTFSRAFGGNMLSVAAYYLMSPFNLVFYFFDAEHINTGILIIALLKTGFIGLSMYQYLTKKQDDSAAILFAVSYAFCAYTIGYLFNIFWMDSLILLPYIVMSIESLVDKGKFIAYTIFISLVIVTNFYMGYMVCLFSVLYFLCYFFSVPRQKGLLRTFLLYGVSSLLGGMLSMWLTLPVVFTLLRGKSTFSAAKLFDFHSIFENADLIDAVFSATTGSMPITEGKPLIYCGILPLILAVYQIICGQSSRRKKICCLLLCTFIVISFNHYNLNCIWHALNYPTGSPHRFAFLFVFLLICLSYNGYQTLKMQTGSKPADMTIIFIGIVLIFVLLCRRKNFMENYGEPVLIFNIVIVIAYTVIFLIRRQKYRLYLFAALLFTELVYNAQNLYCKSEQYASVGVTEYRNYITSVSPLVAQIPENAAPCRTVMTGNAYRTANDSFLFNLYGLDSYTSVEEQRTAQIAHNFGYGFADNILWGIRYHHGATHAADSLLGIKYIVSSENPGNGYIQIGQENNLKLYENTNALPFALLADQSILSLQNTDLHSFGYINQMYHSLADRQSEDILQELPRQLSGVYHCTEQADGSFYAADAASDAYVEYEYVTPMACTVYVSYDNSGVSKAEAFIASTAADLQEEINNVKPLGYFEEGTPLTIRYYLGEGNALFPWEIYVYGESQELLDNYATQIKAQTPDVTMQTDSRLHISCRNTSDETKYLLCSIPWERGWHVYSDGADAETPLSVRNFIVIPVESGVHEIELRYIPQGLTPGIVITLLGTVILFVLYRSQM